MAVFLFCSAKSIWSIQKGLDFKIRETQVLHSVHGTGTGSGPWPRGQADAEGFFFPGAGHVYPPLDETPEIKREVTEAMKEHLATIRVKALKVKQEKKELREKAKQ